MTEERSVLLTAHDPNLVTDFGCPPTDLESAPGPLGITSLSRHPTVFLVLSGAEAEGKEHRFGGQAGPTSSYHLY